MIQQPTFSIVTINLNNKIGLEKTIKSVVNQNFKDFEYIIVDGGSTDGSLEIIRKYESFIDYWVSEPDEGIYFAQNKGIKLTNGRYITFLNSGDYFYDENVLENVYVNLNKGDVIYGNLVRVVNDKQQFIKYPDPFNTFYFFKIGLCPQTAFVRRSWHLKYPFDTSLKIFADKDFFMKILFKNAVFYHINKYIVFYDGTGFSTREELKPIAIQEYEKVINRYLPYHLKSEYDVLYRIPNLFYIIDNLKKYPALRILSGKFLLGLTKVYKFYRSLKGWLYQR